MELRTEMVTDHAAMSSIVLPGGETQVRTSVHFDQQDHKWTLNVEIGNRDDGWDYVVCERKLVSIDEGGS